VAKTPRGSVTLVLALSTLALTGTALWAQGGRPSVPDLQNSSYFGLGYVVSIPNMFVGVAALGLTPDILGGAGLYADVKFTHDSPGGDPYLIDDITVEEAENTFGDLLFEQRSAWLSIDLAVVYAVRRDFAVYAGGGYSREQHYHQYYDDSLTRGLEGFYWVLDEAESGNRVNALGGVFFRVGRYVAFQLGVESRPGAMVGVMFTLPL